MQKCSGAVICKNEWPKRWQVQQPSLQRCIITVKGAMASWKEARPQKITWQRCLPGGTVLLRLKDQKWREGAGTGIPEEWVRQPRAGLGHWWGGHADVFAQCPLGAALPHGSHCPWPSPPETISHRIPSLLLSLSLLQSSFQGRALAQPQLSCQEPRGGKWLQKRETVAERRLVAEDSLWR